MKILIWRVSNGMRALVLLEMVSRDRARLISSTSGTWDSSCSGDADAGMLGYWISLMGASASARGQHGWVKSGKSLPRVQATNTSSTTEKRSGGEQPEQLLGDGWDPTCHGKRDYLLCQVTNVRGKALYHECRAHPLPPRLSSASSMGASDSCT